MNREGNHVEWSKGQKKVFVEQQSAFSDTHYKEAGLTIKMVNFARNLNFSQGEFLLMEGNIRYLSVGVEEIIERLSLALQKGPFTDSMVRTLINPTVTISPAEFNSGGNKMDAK